MASGNNNTFSGGANILFGAIQVTATTGSPLGSGAVNVNPGTTLRLAGLGSLETNDAGTTFATLNVASNPIAAATAAAAVTGLGVIGLDASFDPSTLLNQSANSLSVWGTAVQIETPVFASSIGSMGGAADPVFFGAAGSFTYTGSSIAANGDNVIRLGANATAATTLTIAGADNSLANNGSNVTGLVIGSPLANITGVGPNASINSVGTVIIQDSNSFSGNVTINKASTLTVQTGGATGSTPLGTGTSSNTIEIFGTLDIGGATRQLAEPGSNHCLALERHDQPRQLLEPLHGRRNKGPMERLRFVARWRHPHVDGGHEPGHHPAHGRHHRQPGEHHQHRSGRHGHGGVGRDQHHPIDRRHVAHYHHERQPARRPG